MSRPGPAAPADTTTPPPPVVVVHPMHQHAYETAAAADKAGLLNWFVTGIYCTGRGVANPDRWAWLPGPVERAVEGKLRARWHPEIDSRRVHAIVRHHALAAGARLGLAWLPSADAYDLLEWASRRFDATVARRLRRTRHRGLVHAFEGGCIRTLQAAKRQGAVTVLDVPSAHEYHLDAIEAEGGTADRRMTTVVRAERALADYLLAPSEFVVRCLVEHGAEPAKILRIPYGVDPARFTPRRRPARGRRLRVLFVGRISHAKGVHYLLAAWRRLALRDAELILVGPADRAGTRLLAEHQGSHRWLGALPRHQLRPWFERSDLFVFPSLAEGSALVTYEAMASGLPLVVTPTSGSMVRDGVDGFVVPARDVDAICERVHDLHADPEARHEMGARGRALIEDHYTWQHYHDRLASTYRAILASQPIGALD